MELRRVLSAMEKGDLVTPGDIDLLRPLLAQVVEGQLDIRSFKALEDELEGVPRLHVESLFDPTSFTAKRREAALLLKESRTELWELAVAALAYFKLDPRVAFSPDGRLWLEGVHDSTLKSLEVSESGSVTIEFHAPILGQVIRFRFDEAANPVVWSGGDLMPLIVAAITLSPFPTDLNRRIGVSHDELLRFNKMGLSLRAEWAFLVEPILGGGLAIAGRGNFSDHFSINVRAE